MIRNYFKIAYRNLINNKFFSIINLLGLTIGITISILIFTWVMHEVSYDKFHVNSKNIYRIQTLSGEGTGYGSPPLLSPTIKDEIPTIVNSCRIDDMPKFQFKVDEFVDYETKGLCVDSSFFEIFSFELIKGDIKNILFNVNEYMYKYPEFIGCMLITWWQGFESAGLNYNSEEISIINSSNNNINNQQTILLKNIFAEADFKNEFWDDLMKIAKGYSSNLSKLNNKVIGDFR